MKNILLYAGIVAIGVLLGFLLFGRAPEQLGGVGSLAKFHTFVNGTAATTTGTAVRVSDYNSLVISLVTDTATNTVKCAGSIQSNPPTFEATRSATNMWGYVSLTDLQTGTAIDGAAGISATGTSLFKQYKVNVSENLTYLDCSVVNWTTGTTTIRAFLKAN